jgi:hypothetical protein
MTDQKPDQAPELRPNGKIKILSAQDILEMDDVRTVDVDVPEWGGVVRLRSLTAEEMTEFVDQSGRDKGESTVKLLVLCSIDESGQRLFTSSHMALLKKKNLRAFMRVQTEALKLNGLDEESQKARKND